MKSASALLLFAAVAFAERVTLHNTKDCSDEGIEFNLGANAHEVCTPTPNYTAIKMLEPVSTRYDCPWMFRSSDCSGGSLEVFSSGVGICSNTYYENDGVTPLTYNSLRFSEC